MCHSLLTIMICRNERHSDSDKQQALKYTRILMTMIEFTSLVAGEVNDLDVRFFGYPGPGHTPTDGFSAHFSNAHRFAISVQALPLPVLFGISTGFVKRPRGPLRPTRGCLCTCGCRTLSQLISYLFTPLPAPCFIIVAVI